ncbi:MAG: acyltransferase [Aquabacterium sp.]|uniref:acyltransferase family protein n=1 Tax=Aquabacterium sp. TaxID=1872578 RepID=UPI00271D34DC|nr:acyltransferase [Aquabacterium sp.]MDO9002146.1 acyltransferase [Aquabacterium sp.]
MPNPITTFFTAGQPTLAARLMATNNRPSGFDYMRIVLALGVIASHAFLLSYGPDVQYGRLANMGFSLTTLIVPMFFALSGFLVAGSLERTRTLVSFMGLRVFRIMPALSVEVLLSALILGPLLTTLPLGEYLTHPDFHMYFWNVLGHIHYELPGLFETNPLQSVNGQLWTVPYELACYVVLCMLAVLGIFKDRIWLLWFMVLLHALQIGNTILRPNLDYHGAGGTTLVMAFIAGLLVYRFRDKLVWSARCALAMAALSLLLITLPNGIRFAALPIAYFTVYLGLLNPPRQATLLGGDYSYGIYLYGYPIQQMVVALLPQHREWYINMLLATPCTIAIAYCSWWLIEKPVMDRRQILTTLENWYLSKVAGKVRSPST